MICLKSAQAIVQDKDPTQVQEYFMGELIQISPIEKPENFEGEASIIGGLLGKQKTTCIETKYWRDLGRENYWMQVI